MPVGLYRDGKKRKRRAAARARAVAAGVAPDAHPGRADPMITTAAYVPARPASDRAERDEDDLISVNGPAERW